MSLRSQVRVYGAVAAVREWLRAVDDRGGAVTADELLEVVQAMQDALAPNAQHVIRYHGELTATRTVRRRSWWRRLLGR